MKGYLVEVVVTEFTGVVHKRIESIDLRAFKENELEQAKDFATIVSETMFQLKREGKV